MAEDESSTPRATLPSLAVLVAVAVVPPVFATGYTEFETIKEVALVALAGLGLIAWGGSVLRGRKITMTGGRVQAVLATFVLFVALSLIWAPAWQSGMMPALHWIAASALFILVTSAVGRPLEFVTVATAAAVGAGLSGAFGLLDLAGVGVFTKVWDPPGVAGSFDAREFAIGYYAAAVPLLAAAAVRTTGIARVVAIVGGVLAAAHFGLVADVDTLVIWGIILVAVTLLIAILQGFSRLPLLFGVLGAASIALLLALGIAIARPAVGPATDATALPWVDTGKPDRDLSSAEIRDARFAIRRTEEAPNWEARSYVTGIAFDLFREQPIIGHGPGAWWTLQTKYPRSDEPFAKGLFERWPAFRSPHNAFARIMTEYGGVGLFLLLAWLSTVIALTVTALARKEELENWIIEHWALTSSVTAGCVFAVFTPGIDRAPAAALVFVAAGLLVRESAALNEYKGLSEIWTINSKGRRWDTGFFTGVLPVAVGLAAVVFAGWYAVAEFYRSWGDLAMLRTEHEKAADVYAQADEILGGDGEALYNRALALRRTGQKGAVELTNEAAKLREYDVRIVNQLSAIHLSDQNYAEAVTAARRAVELFPNYIEGRRNLAAALDLQGRVAEASAELLEVLELDPPDKLKARIHRELGQYYEGPLDNAAKAVEHYEKALQLTDDQFIKQDIKPRIEELKKEIQRNRLMREGKPIPKELMPGEAPDPHDGHGH